MNGIVNEGPWPQLETMCSSQADWHIADFCDKFIWGQIKCCIYTASTQLFNSSFQVKEIDARRRKKNPTCQIAKMCVQSWHVQFPMEWEQGENLPRTWVGSRGKGCLWGKAAWGNRQTQTVAQGGLSFNVWSATYWGFHGSSEVKKKKKTPINAGDVGLITGSEMSPEKGNGNSLQCSCLGNPMDRGAWWAIVLGVTESPTWLND